MHLRRVREFRRGSADSFALAFRQVVSDREPHAGSETGSPGHGRAGFLLGTRLLFTVSVTFQAEARQRALRESLRVFELEATR